jgi:hypothetical protein
LIVANIPITIDVNAVIKKAFLTISGLYWFTTGHNKIPNGTIIKLYHKKDINGFLLEIAINIHAMGTTNHNNIVNNVSGIKFI